jgi:hypothetical protein
LKGEHELKPYVIGGVSMSIYDHRRVLRNGYLQLRLWSGRSGELETACVENTSKKSHLSNRGKKRKRNLLKYLYCAKKQKV